MGTGAAVFPYRRGTGWGVLGAALGADCFLAANYLIGGIPALLCGAAIAFWAVKSGVLFAGRNSQAVALLALLPTLLWGILSTI